MDVKEAVATAKKFVTDIFEGENLADVGLEEVVFDDGAKVWKVTVGFNRPWDRLKGLADVMSAAPNRRSFKVVQIEDRTGRVVSLTHRKPAA